LKEHGFEVLENRVGKPLIFEELKELAPMVVLWQGVRIPGTNPCLSWLRS